MTIFKTNAKATYLEGVFYLRDRATTRWGGPIYFPTVFVAYGAAIKSGNWRYCSSVNTPQYVIDNYFNSKKGNMSSFWDAVFALENITWVDVKNDKEHILTLINNANNELLKLGEL